MAKWIMKIDVSDIWQKYEDDNDFEAFKSELLPVLQSKTEKISNVLGEDEAREYEDMVQEIEFSADDEDEFDYIWQDLYDWADANKVWISTF
jgi:Zn-dependent M32 family carboxypeptidase